MCLNGPVGNHEFPTLVTGKVVTALHELDCFSLDPQMVNDTLGVLLKYQDDISRMEGSQAKQILNQVKDEIRHMKQG